MSEIKDKLEIARETIKRGLKKQKTEWMKRLTKSKIKK